jgi:hypothetical protein
VNRRGFLRGVLGLAAAPLLPAAALGAKEVLGYTFFTKSVVLNEHWVGFIHTSDYDDLVAPAPMEIGSWEGMRYIDSRPAGVVN